MVAEELEVEADKIKKLKTVVDNIVIKKDAHVASLEDGVVLVAILKA